MSPIEKRSIMTPYKSTSKKRLAVFPKIWDAWLLRCRLFFEKCYNFLSHFITKDKVLQTSNHQNTFWYQMSFRMNHFATNLDKFKIFAKLSAGWKISEISKLSKVVVDVDLSNLAFCSHWITWVVVGLLSHVGFPETTISLR